METTRAKVVEKAVGFEEMISQLLSMLLEVDKNNSISFGTKNLALSFNAKINLLVDLKFMPREFISDFQLFAEIRNKFAHVLYADNFTKCLELLSTSSKNKFKKNFVGNTDNTDEEVIYMTCFEFLCFRLGIWLRVTLKMISEKQSQDLKKVGAVEMIRSFINYDDSKKIEQLDSFLNTITPIINEIQPNDEFLKEYHELLKKQEDELNI